MARLPGRDNRIAIPALVLSAAVVGALVWFAVPAVPLVLGWGQGALVGAVTAGAPSAAAEEVLAEQVDVATADCRTYYPAGLWNELMWTPSVLLNQTTDRPVITAVDLVDALAPSPVRTCAWSNGTGGTIVTSFAQVQADAAAIADAALRGQGYTCTSVDHGVSCVLSNGDVSEYQRVQGGLWMSSVQSAWHPTDYDTQVADHVWK